MKINVVLLLFLGLAACREESQINPRSGKDKPVITVSSGYVDKDVSITTIEGFVRSYGVGVDDQGNIYVPDMPAHNIVKFSKDYELLGAFDISDGELKPISTAGKEKKRSPPSQGLIGPHSVSFDQHQFMYITEYFGGRVSKISPSNVLVDRIGSSGELNRPVVSYVESDGKLYVGNYGSNQIMRYDLTGQLQGWVGSTKDGQAHDKWRTSGVPIEGKILGGLNKPHSARLGPDGNIYVVDTWNHRIVKYSYNGEYLGWTGAKADGSATHGWAKSGESKNSNIFGGFDAPIELEMDGSGIMYVTDMRNHRVVRVGLDGKVTGWLGGIGSGNDRAIWRKDGIPVAGKTLTSFNEPYGIRVTNGKIYVSDTNNQRVVIIDALKLGVK